MHLLFTPGFSSCLRDHWPRKRSIGFLVSSVNVQFIVTPLEIKSLRFGGESPFYCTFDICFQIRKLNPFLCWANSLRFLAPCCATVASQSVSTFTHDPCLRLRKRVREFIFVLQLSSADQQTKLTIFLGSSLMATSCWPSLKYMTDETTNAERTTRAYSMICHFLDDSLNLNTFKCDKS